MAVQTRSAVRLKWVVDLFVCKAYGFSNETLTNVRATQPVTASAGSRAVNFKMNSLRTPAGNYISV